MKRNYLTVDTEVSVDINLADYADEIREFIDSETGELWGELVRLYQRSGADEVLEYVEQKMRDQSGLPIVLFQR